MHPRIQVVLSRTSSSTRLPRGGCVPILGLRETCIKLGDPVEDRPWRPGLSGRGLTLGVAVFGQLDALCFCFAQIAIVKLCKRTLTRHHRVAVGTGVVINPVMIEIDAHVLLHPLLRALSAYSHYP